MKQKNHSGKHKNSVRTLPPDSGNWFFNIEISRWEEADWTVGPETDSQYREVGAKRIMIDGFPRQGNRFLRFHALSGIPQLAIPSRLSHSQKIIENAVNNVDCIILTTRKPEDAISSYISMSTSSPGGGFSPIIKALSSSLYTKDDEIYINKCINYYTRMTNLCIDLKDYCYLAQFEIFSKLTHIEICKKLLSAVNSDLYVNSEIHSLDGRSNSTSNELLKKYILSDRFAEAMKQATDAYIRAVSKCRHI
jgi:hypothetical protein